jgi:hypothetical protein
VGTMVTRVNSVTICTVVSMVSQLVCEVLHFGGQSEPCSKLKQGCYMHIHNYICNYHSKQCYSSENLIFLTLKQFKNFFNSKSYY